MNRLIFYIVFDVIIAIAAACLFDDSIITGIVLIILIFTELGIELLLWLIRKILGFWKKSTYLLTKQYF